MRILVISDSHGRNDDIEGVLKQVGGNNMMIHCGDVRPDRTKVEVDERRIDEGTTPQG